MANWKSEWERAVDYIAATYPGASVGTNSAGHISNIAHEEMDAVQLEAMVTDLQQRFPNAFVKPPAPPPPPPPARPLRECPDCAERILAVAKKCRFCHSAVTPLT